MEDRIDNSWTTAILSLNDQTKPCKTGIELVKQDYLPLVYVDTSVAKLASRDRAENDPMSANSNDERRE